MTKYAAAICRNHLHPVVWCTQQLIIINILKYFFKLFFADFVDSPPDELQPTIFLKITAWYWDFQSNRYSTSISIFNHHIWGPYFLKGILFHLQINLIYSPTRLSYQRNKHSSHQLKFQASLVLCISESITLNSLE